MSRRSPAGGLSRLPAAAFAVFVLPVVAALATYQALAAATRNPAEYLGAAREWGTLAVGRRADFLLVDGNPLHDITNTGRIAAVGFGGRWIERAELDGMSERGRRAIGAGGAPDTVPAPSAAWLAMLPDGETKRRFILDCTGCHQFDGRIAMPEGRLRTRDEWSTAIARMLEYAGPNSSFPVISSAAHPDSTAAWLARHLQSGPAVLLSRRGAEPPSDQSAEPPSPADIREFLFPNPQDLPHDVAIAGDGHIVVTGMFSDAMHVLDPSSGAWRQVPIPVPQANPRAVEIGRQGEWWAVLGGPNKLARYDGMRWETYDVGVYAHSVALDSNGGAWANGHFSRAPEVIVEIDGAGNRREYELPEHPTMAAEPGGPIPYELRTGPDGGVWMSELQGNRIVRLDPMTGRAKAYELPTPFSGPRRHDVAPDGIVWIPAYAAGALVRFDPSAERFEEIALPVGDALPYVARVDATRDRVWVGTGAADELLAYRPSSGRWERYPLPSRGALVRHIAIDHRSGDVWLAYGESPGKLPARIARVRVR